MILWNIKKTSAWWNCAWYTRYKTFTVIRNKQTGQKKTFITKFNTLQKIYSQALCLYT